MKKMLCSAPAWSLLAVCLPLLCSASSHQGEWPVREEENIQKTLPLTGSPMRLVVDNVEGFVHVTGVSGQDVQIKAHKTIRAQTDADLAKAKSEVSLNITPQPGEVSVYYDAPWRCKNGGGEACHGEHRRFYSVAFDIDVEVPASARLVISTINEGDIEIDKATGDFEVNDVNGGIHMSEIGGSGSAHTVNGPVSIRFAKNPTRPCSFKSINGALDAYFQPQLSADLLFKTFNGQVYSDFDVSALAVPASATTERRDGKFIYHSNGLSGARAGNGGPELSFDTLNGSIRIHREQ